MLLYLFNDLFLLFFFGFCSPVDFFRMCKTHAEPTLNSQAHLANVSAFIVSGINKQVYLLIVERERERARERKEEIDKSSTCISLLLLFYSLFENFKFVLQVFPLFSFHMHLFKSRMIYPSISAKISLSENQFIFCLLCSLSCYNICSVALECSSFKILFKQNP